MLKERILREGKNFALIFLYLWIILGLFSLYKSLILGQAYLFNQAMAILNALVLGKIMATLEFLRVGETFQQKPPVYRILFKAVLFALLLLSFSVLELGARGWLNGRGFSESIAQSGRGSVEGLSVLTIIISVALLPYFTYRELSWAIGERELRSLIFHRRLSTGDFPAGSQEFEARTSPDPPAIPK